MRVAARPEERPAAGPPEVERPEGERPAVEVPGVESTVP